MTANRPANPYQAPRPGKPATRDSVAEDLVRSWSPGQRARARADALADIEAGASNSDTLRQFVALIDKVSEEEKVA